MGELHGKGWRVLGYFVWMLGAGVYLDSELSTLSMTLLLTGAVAFAAGAAQSAMQIGDRTR